MKWYKVPAQIDPTWTPPDTIRELIVNEENLKHLDKLRGAVILYGAAMPIPGATPEEILPYKFYDSSGNEIVE